jgi:hypothetical protein
MFHRCLQQTTRPSVNGGWLWAGLILGLAVLNSKASAAVTLTAVADGYAIDGGVFVRDGVFDALESDSGGLVFGIIFNPGHSESAEYRTMLEYSLSGFSPSTVIQSATLDLKPFISPVGANQVDIFGYVGNGTVELADALAGTLVSSRSFGSSFFGPLRFDVTTFLQERVAAGDSFAGLGFESAIQVRLTIFSFHSHWNRIRYTTVRYLSSKLSLRQAIPAHRFRRLAPPLLSPSHWSSGGWEHWDVRLGHIGGGTRVGPLSSSAHEAMFHLRGRI